MTKHLKNMQSRASNHSLSTDQSKPFANAKQGPVVAEEKSDAGMNTKAQKLKQCKLRIDTAPTELVTAWILYVLDVVHSHSSLNSAGNKGALFRLMFPGHPNAEKFGELSRHKLSYIIVHGLSRLFRNRIHRDLQPTDRLPLRFSSCFDESFNKVTYSKQMDIHILYFDDEIGRVRRKYIDAQFMGHATANDTMLEFERAHSKLDISRCLVQLSMDGPNVNWKFLDDLEERRLVINPEAPDLLNIGSCGIHVLHGTYKTAHTKETDWCVDQVMKAAHGIFKKSPARRSDFLADNEIPDNGDDQSLKSYFPLKFAGHRWLENGKCLERYLEIQDKIANFMKASELKNRKNFGPKDERKPLLVRVTNSLMFKVYCEFSLSICRDIEPFLTLFQAERPLCVFLFSKLVDLLTTLMQRFIRKDVLDSNSSASKLMRIDVRAENNILPLESVKIGFGAKRALRQLKSEDKTKARTFRKEARDFLACIVEKMKERSPLKYTLTRPLSSLSPIDINAKGKATIIGRFSKLCEIICDKKWLAIRNAQNAERQFDQLLSNVDFVSKSESFDIHNDRVDVFWSEICDSHSMIDLLNIIRLVLVISHGNDRVESGFSINGDIILPNMLCESIVAQRIVYEAVAEAGNATKVLIDEEMITYVRDASRQNTLAEQEKQRKQTEGQKKIAEKRKITADLKKAVALKKVKVDEMRNMVLQTDKELQDKLRQ